MSTLRPRFVRLLAFGFVMMPCFEQVRAVDYYLSPTGKDSNSGTSLATPWATFAHAWKELHPGDILYLLDGIYRQSIEPNVRNGQPGAPITVKALNDGQAMIDGEGIRETVTLGGGDNPTVGHYFIVEGIVAANSSKNVYEITGSHNVLRRVSGYNANTDENVSVIAINYPSAQYNLVEDCVAAGTGRKMIILWHSSKNIVRRCFANWQGWDGRNACQEWPWGENIDVYGSNDNIIENSIGYGSVPYFSITVRTNDAEHGASGNKMLGDIAVYAGMNRDGRAINWPSSRLGPTSCTAMRDWTSSGQRSGFKSYSHDGRFDGNMWQDILAWGNAGHGFSATGNVLPVKASINRATIINNGLDNGYRGNTKDGPIGTDVVFTPELLAMSITDSAIEGTSYNGEGARLEHRYVNGVLMDGSDGQPAQPLWPWPMESRIRTELNLSVTDEVYYGIVKGNAPPVPPTLRLLDGLAPR